MKSCEEKSKLMWVSTENPRLLRGDDTGAAEDGLRADDVNSDEWQFRSVRSVTGVKAMAVGLSDMTGALRSEAGLKICGFELIVY